MDSRKKLNQPDQSEQKAALPTARDRENARVRQAIAEAQEQLWQECNLLALGAFGPGWEPACRHVLIDKAEEDACRKSGAKPRLAATVYTVKKDGQKRHFTVEGGEVIEHDDYKVAFGPMLLEPHPTQTIEVRGQLVHPHRYSLCFAPYERYRPRSAEELAALRASRERKQLEREAKRDAEAFPLFFEFGSGLGNETAENGR